MGRMGQSKVRERLLWKRLQMNELVFLCACGLQKGIYLLQVFKLAL